MFSCFTIGLKKALDVCVKYFKKLQSKCDEKQDNVINSENDRTILNEVAINQPMCGHIGHYSENLESVLLYHVSFVDKVSTQEALVLLGKLAVTSEKFQDTFVVSVEN
jgi:hypothetical protein